MRRIPEKAEGQAVLHSVADVGAAPSVGEGVLVAPERVRPAKLDVDEAHPGLPEGDRCAPAEAPAEKREAIVDERAFLEARRDRREDLEVEERGRQCFQVSRLREEGEDLPPRAGTTSLRSRTCDAKKWPLESLIARSMREIGACE
jgi:hypothetical protein